MVQRIQSNWAERFASWQLQPQNVVADENRLLVDKYLEKLKVYHQNPGAVDFNELMYEQEHLLNRMRQTPHWDEGYDGMAQEHEQMWEGYWQETGTKHPYR